MWAFGGPDGEGDELLKAWDPKGLILTTGTTWGEVPGSKPIYDYETGAEDAEPDWAKVNNWETISGYCKEFAEIKQLDTYCCQAFEYPSLTDD